MIGPSLLTVIHQAPVYSEMLVVYIPPIEACPLSQSQHLLCGDQYVRGWQLSSDELHLLSLRGGTFMLCYIYIYQSQNLRSLRKIQMIVYKFTLKYIAKI